MKNLLNCHERYFTDPVCTGSSFRTESIQNEQVSTGDYLFVNEALPDSTLSETQVGIILLVASLVVLCSCLVVLVKVLSSLMKGSMAKIIMKVSVRPRLPTCKN